MPKRRVRTAAQIAASKRNLEKARKAKARNTIPRSEYGGKKWRGPMVELYHATTEANAKLIRKNGFQWKEGRNLSMSGVKDPIWFSKVRPSTKSSPLDWVTEKFGKPIGKTVDKNGHVTAFKYPKPVLFSVRVRLKKTKRDKHIPPGMKAIQSRVVSAEYLRGKKIREIK